MGNHRYKIPLSKADDWTRRAFIKRASLFLGAFGVPWLIRMETMEKVSKKIFGSAVAWAQSGTPKYLISLRFRSGYQNSLISPTEGDVSAETFPNRNYHANTVITVPSGAGGTGSNRPLFLSPQMATFATAHPTRMASLTSLRNITGHTNAFADSTLSQSTPDWFNAHAAQMNQIAQPSLSQGIIYGDPNDANFSALSSLGSEFTPIYVSSSDSVRGLFQAFQMKASDGTVFSQNLSNDIFSVIETNFNEPFLKLIEGRPGASSMSAGMTKLKDLLGKNLSAQLTPSQALLDSINTQVTGGVAAPNQRLSTVLGNTAADMAELFAMAGLLFANGITTQVGIVFETGDWHGVNARPQVGNPGNNTVQGTHAAFWSQQFTNVLNQYATNPLFQGTSGAIGNNTYIVLTSEFSRSVADPIATPNNNDGDNRHIIIIGPNGAFNAGTYGNASMNDLEPIKCNPDTGADDGIGQLDRPYGYNTILKVLGIDPTDVGVSSADADKYVKAIKA